MQLFSYILSMFATVLNFCEPFCKKMRHVLTLYFTTNAVIGISYLLTGSYSGGMCSFVGAFQIMINYFYNSRGKKLPLKLIILHALALCFVNFLSFKYWYDLFIILSSLAFVLSMAQTEVKIYRVLCITNILLFMCYDFTSGAYGNLIMHTIQVSVILVGVCVRTFRTKRC